MRSRLKSGELSAFPKQKCNFYFNTGLRYGHDFFYRLGCRAKHLRGSLPGGEFYPVFSYDDFATLPKYHVYVKLLIDGTESKGFSAVTVSNFE